MPEPTPTRLTMWRDKISKIDPLHFIWVAVLFSEVLTGLSNSVLSLIWWGHISRDLLIIGSIDAFVVSLIVAIIVIYFLNDATRLNNLNQHLREDLKKLQTAEAALAAEKERYRTLLDTSTEGIVVARIEDLRIKYINPTASRFLGYDRPELLNLPITDIHPPESLPLVLAEFNALRLEQKKVAADIPCLRHDKTIVYADVYSSPVVVDGEPCLMGFFRDVSERRQAETALRESEERYRTVVEESFDAILVHDGRYIVFANNKTLEMFDYEKSQLIGLDFKELSHPDSYELMRQRAAARLRGEIVPSCYEVKLIRRDGSAFPAEISARTVNMGGRKYVQTWIRDISERLRAEEALRESEHKFATAFRSNPGSISIRRLDTDVYVEVNRGFTDMYGYEPKEALGRTPDSLGIWVTRPHRYAERLRLLRETGMVRDFEFTFRRKNGELGTALNSAEVIELKGEPHVLSISHDITQRKKAEEENSRLATAIEHAAEDIIITDSFGNIVYVNPAFERVTGYSRPEVLGKNPRLLKSGKHDQHFYRDMWATISNGKVWTGQLIDRRKDGKIIFGEATISPIIDSSAKIKGYVAVKRDVTEQRQLEAQARQSQKMEALGTLAGGIAHDFNNILTIIMGYAQMAIRRSSDPELKDDLSHIMSGSLRAMDLIKHILAFSRQTETEYQPVDIRHIVAETMRLIRASFPATIEVQIKMTPQRTVVFSDPTQVHQIIMNLCTNALYAMMSTGGTLIVELERVELTPEETRPLAGLSAGAYVLLMVRDTGPGIPPEIINNIFDPYFTTKSLGEGTGLGLATVHGLVKSHRGAIQVISAPGQGAAFHVFLPILDSEEITADRPVAPLPRGTEHILVVDDEEAVAEVSQDMLETLGYDVEILTRPQEALAAFRQDPDRYDLVLTDMTMPKMTGLDLARELKQLRPDLPIVLCTGFSQQVTPEALDRLGIKGLLMKPLILTKMARIIRSALDAGRLDLRGDLEKPS